MRFRAPYLNRPMATTVIAIAVCGGATARLAAATLTCINPYSGANWKISVDFAKSTVDSNPARIDDAKISWHDRTAGGNYTLDRKSGKLTVIIPSSTGGYFLYDRCKPD